MTRVPRSVAGALRALLAKALVSALLLAGLATGAAIVSAERARLAKDLVTLAGVVGNAVVLRPTAGAGNDLQDMLGLLRSEPMLRSVTAYDASGVVVADVDFRDSAESADDRLRRWGIADITTDTQTIRFAGLADVHIHVPLRRGPEAAGSIDFDAELTPLYATIEHVLAGLLLVGVPAALFAFVITHRARARVAKPVARLAEGLQEIRETGRYGQRLESGADGELGQLADGINALCSDVVIREGQLRAYQAEVDSRVRKRTLELDAAVAAAQEAAKRAEGDSRAKSDFLARMSHEIRTPMNGVLGMAELLGESPTLDERQRRYTRTIQQSGAALLQIINDILDFSKVEAGKLQLDKAPFCVREVVEDAVEILAERANGKGLALICDIPASLETAVVGDALRLRQIIINLISNAVKFTERGEIRVKVHSTNWGFIDSTFHFEVSDTGIGIRPESCATIFEAFAQEDGSTTRVYGGTGLGLAICRQLVELMGGKIGVTSTPGVGSTFRFSVPLSEDTAAETEQRRTAFAAARMLIVDAHPSSRAMLRQQLSGWGVKVTEAPDAARALDIIDEAFGAEFDVIIADGQMTQMDGASLAKEIRSRWAFAEVPLFLLHKGLAPPPVEGGAGSGRTTWIGTPLRIAHLRACLAGVLTRRAASETSSSDTVIQPAPAAESRRVAVRRVLVVEDNPVNQEVALAMLSELGVEAVSAWTGEEALAMLAAERYDAVLMDCQMPKLDGYETTRRLRAFEREQALARTPVLALTANAMSGDAEKCHAAGMDGYLGKPFTKQQLLELLQNCAAPIPPTSAATTAKARERTAAELTDGEVEAVLDARALEHMRSLRRPGAEDMVARIVNLYGTSSLTIVDELRAALERADAAAVDAAAHALRSSSANVGARRLASACRAVEAAAATGNWDEIRQLADALVAEHAAVMTALSAVDVAA